MGRMLFRGWTVSRVGVFVRPRSCPGSAIRGAGLVWSVGGEPGQGACPRIRWGILAALRGSMEWRSLETGPAVVVSRGPLRRIPGASAAALRVRFGADGLGEGADGRRPVNRAEAASLPQTLWWGIGLRRHCGPDLVRMVWAEVQTAGGR